jgi:hypothetical protein
MGGACGMYGETQIAYRVLMENLTAIGHLDNLGIYGILSKMGLQDIRWDGMD